MQMKMSSVGRQMLIGLEGFKSKAYADSKGLLTIGVGHLLSQQERQNGTIIINNEAVAWQQGLSESHVDALLAQDLPIYESIVNRLVTIDLTQYQFDALVSFVFNIGEPQFSSSNLLYKLNTSALDAIPNEFRRWRFVTDSNGKKREITGLTNRRKTEVACWLGELSGYPVPSSTAQQAQNKSGIIVNGQTVPTLTTNPQPSLALPAPTTPRQYKPDRWLDTLNPLDWFPKYGTYVSSAAAFALFVIDAMGYPIHPMIYALLGWFAMARMRRAIDRPSYHYPSYGDY